MASAYSANALAARRHAQDTSVTVDETGGPDFSQATSFGLPWQIQLWSNDLISGKPSAEPTKPIEEWLAPILGPEGDVLGTYRVWRPSPGSEAELAGYDGDIELASALQKIDPQSALVSDPTIGAWYALSEGTVTALNQSAAREVPSAMPIDEVAGLVSARYAEAITKSQENGYGMNPWILGAGSVMLLAAAIGLIWRIRSVRADRGIAATGS